MLCPLVTASITKSGKSLAQQALALKFKILSSPSSTANSGSSALSATMPPKAVFIDSVIFSSLNPYSGVPSIESKIIQSRMSSGSKLWERVPTETTKPADVKSFTESAKLVACELVSCGKISRVRASTLIGFFPALAAKRTSS